MRHILRISSLPPLRAASALSYNTDATELGIINAWSTKHKIDTSTLAQRPHRSREGGGEGEREGVGQRLPPRDRLRNNLSARRGGTAARGRKVVPPPPPQTNRCCCRRVDMPKPSNITSRSRRASSTSPHTKSAYPLRGTQVPSREKKEGKNKIPNNTPTLVIL